MSARLDYAVGGDAGYTGQLEGDVFDNQSMQPFAPDPGRPWWEGIAVYGITRAIDNRFGPPPVQGNTSPGSFAGQNGRTYSNANAPQGPAPASGGMSPLLMLAIGAVVVALIVRG